MSQLHVTLDYYAPQVELTPKALAAAGGRPNNAVWAPRSPLQTNGKVNPMKTLSMVSLGTVLTLGMAHGMALGGCSQTPKTETAATSEVVTLRSETVEVACGHCVYDMAGVNSCQLAAKIDNGDPMLVTGSDLDMHEHPNLCSTVSDAVVTGEVEGDILVVTAVEIK